MLTRAVARHFGALRHKYLAGMLLLTTSLFSGALYGKFIRTAGLAGGVHCSWISLRRAVSSPMTSSAIRFSTRSAASSRARCSRSRTRSLNSGRLRDVRASMTSMVGLARPAAMRGLPQKRVRLHVLASYHSLPRHVSKINRNHCRLSSYHVTMVHTAIFVPTLSRAVAHGAVRR